MEIEEPEFIEEPLVFQSAEQLEDIYKSYQRGQTPPERIDLDLWADKYRYINEVSGEKWHTSRVEVARGPMKAVTEPGVRTITAMTATQILKTELLLNTIGYFMHIDPCSILAVQPTEGIARKFSDVRLKKMVKATPVLQDKFSDGGKYAPANTVGFKEFPGGFISIVGSQAPAGLAMLPCRLVVLDECDKYTEAGNEGDPIILAEERQATFSTDSLSIRTCSPTVAGQSRIEAEYNQSDMRKPFVSCPHCNKWQILKWSNVKWDKDAREMHDPDSVNYLCDNDDCGCLWDENERLKALKNVQWRQTSEFMCRQCEHTNDPSKWDDNAIDKWELKDHVYRAVCEECGVGKCPNRHAGFWVSKLYSPFRPLSELVQKWINAQGNIEKLKAFVNTQLAEVWQESGDHIGNVDGLIGRRERYENELPFEVGVITAGVDVQNNRLEAVIIGYGPLEESWVLKRLIIPGDPSKPDVWFKLDEELITRAWRRGDGKVSYVAAACVDLGGGHTHNVAMYCKDKIERRIWPIRGIASVGRAFPIWPKAPGRTDKIQLPFYNVGVDSAKNVIFSRLLNEKAGPGYYHFPLNPECGVDADFFEQLTAEKRVLRYKGTQRFYVWENPQRKRNEVFDCFVYSYAALNGLMSEGMQLDEVCENGYFMLDSEHEKPPTDDEPSPNIPNGNANEQRSTTSNNRSRPRKIRSNVMR